jgi:hypothetical protein
MKRMLVLEACGNIGETEECKGITSQAKLYGIEVISKCVKNNTELEETLEQNGSFNYIYLSSHGNLSGLGNESGSVDMDWSNFAANLCTYGCMEEDCILMLSCCRGGMNSVAATFFSTCDQVNYVVGPRQSLTSAAMHISFGIFLYNVELREIDPIIACEKIKLATDMRFTCYDKEEWLSQIIFNIKTEEIIDEMKNKA